MRNNFPKIDFLEQCRVIEEDGMTVIQEEEGEGEGALVGSYFEVRSALSL